uniref:Lipoprotein n=1 Tax=Glyptapanteles flavicoxis TaxID=463051 RepID=B7S841_9HYME|nr:hypothetical protein GFP_L7_0080 [Glyptapanteles flavicoxis]ACE75079.1 hypothetical protein GFP_L7_0210 [Glyptapanteles flavicoxis]
MSLHKSALVLFSAILSLSCIQGLPTNREIETTQENPNANVAFSGLLSKFSNTDLGSRILKLDNLVFGSPLKFVLPLSQQVLDNIAVNSNKLESTVGRLGVTVVIPLNVDTSLYTLEAAMQRMPDVGSASEDKVTLSTVTTTETLPVLTAPILSEKKPQQPIEKK